MTASCINSIELVKNYRSPDDPKISIIRALKKSPLTDKGKWTKYKDEYNNIIVQYTVKPDPKEVDIESLSQNNPKYDPCMPFNSYYSNLNYFIETSRIYKEGKYKRTGKDLSLEQEMDNFSEKDLETISHWYDTMTNDYFNYWIKEKNLEKEFYDRQSDYYRKAYNQWRIINDDALELDRRNYDDNASYEADNFIYKRRRANPQLNPELQKRFEEYFYSSDDEYIKWKYNSAIYYLPFLISHIDSKGRYWFEFNSFNRLYYNDFNGAFYQLSNSKTPFNFNLDVKDITVVLKWRHAPGDTRIYFENRTHDTTFLLNGIEVAYHYSKNYSHFDQIYGLSIINGAFVYILL
jgi:hypothetical protein